MTALASSLGASMLARTMQAARYRGVADACPVPCFICEPDGSCAYVNEAYLDLIGAEVEDVLGDNWKQFIFPDDLLWVQASWEESLKAQTVFHQRMRYVNRQTGEVIETQVFTALLPCKGQVGYCMPLSWNCSSLPKRLQHS